MDDKVSVLCTDDEICKSLMDELESLTDEEWLILKSFNGLF